MRFFSAYKDLQSRENTRNAAWQRDGWDEVVYYTGWFQSDTFILKQVLVTASAESCCSVVGIKH